MKKVSIIVSCYNESAALPLFYSEISKILDLLPHYRFELIFVNDGSKDNTISIIQELTSQDSRIRYISFSRNFGKEAAMLAGLEHASGDLITFMDADLQDPPSLLPEMLDFLEQNPDYDSVATRRVSRKGEPPIRSFCARVFYKLINAMSKVEMVDGARDYRLMTRQMVDAILECQEYNRYSKGLWSFVGFQTKWIEFKNVERAAGETHWSFWKLFKYAIEGIVAFSTVPLTLSAFFGILFCLIAFIIIIVVICKTLIFGDPASGWPSLVCIIMFVSGVQLLFLGVIGEYLAKTYLETKHRPHYIIKESNIRQPSVSSAPSTPTPLAHYSTSSSHSSHSPNSSHTTQPNESRHA